MISIPRRRREPLEEQQARAEAALKKSVDGLHAEALELEEVRAQTPDIQRLGQRFLHWQERNHFGPNMARVLGVPR